MHMKIRGTEHTIETATTTTTTTNSDDVEGKIFTRVAVYFNCFWTFIACLLLRQNSRAAPQSGETARNVCVAESMRSLARICIWYVVRWCACGRSVRAVFSCAARFARVYRDSHTEGGLQALPLPMP